MQGNFVFLFPFLEIPIKERSIDTLKIQKLFKLLKRASKHFLKRNFQGKDTNKKKRNRKQFKKMNTVHIE